MLSTEERYKSLYSSCRVLWPAHNTMYLVLQLGSSASIFHWTTYIQDARENTVNVSSYIQNIFRIVLKYPQHYFTKQFFVLMKGTAIQCTVQHTVEVLIIAFVKPPATFVWDMHIHIMSYTLVSYGLPCSNNESAALVICKDECSLYEFFCNMQLAITSDAWSR